MKTTNAKPEKNVSVRKLREILGKTQEQFAAMVGLSVHTIISLENGKNGLTEKTAKRIQIATGADASSLMKGDGKILAVGNQPYTVQRFEWWKTVFASNEKAAEERYNDSHEWLKVVLLAAARPGRAGARDRLPAVYLSFVEWLKQTAEEFKLGPEIDAVIKERTFYIDKKEFKVSDVRARADYYKKHWGFVDSPKLKDGDTITLQQECWSLWNPGGQAPKLRSKH